MNKKIYIFTLILLFSVTCIFSTDQKLNIYNDTILPTSSKIGEVENGKINSLENFTKEIFQQEYSVSWIENNVLDEYKYGFSKENSQILATLLPIKGPIYSTKVSTKANNRALTLLVNHDVIISVIYEKKIDKIISIKFL